MPDRATPTSPDLDAQGKEDQTALHDMLKAVLPKAKRGDLWSIEAALNILDRRAGAQRMAGNGGLVRKAADTTIRALRDAGRLEPIDSARVAALEVLADAVDADPSNASLWREYRTAEIALREVNDVDADEFEQLTRRLSAEVGDSTNPRP